jgi:hypothetical protein
MTNNNMWDCTNMPPMFSAKWNIDDSSVFKKKIVNFWYSSVYLWYIVVFRIKISIRITKKKYVIPFEKKYFGSLPLKRMGYT